jgi:VPDSG-CTERM motif
MYHYPSRSWQVVGTLDNSAREAETDYEIGHRVNTIILRALQHYRYRVPFLAQGLLFFSATTVNPMKINMIPTNKLAMLSAVACAVMLAFTDNARADTSLGFFNPNTLTGDSHVVGTDSDGSPANPTAHAHFINFLITMGLNTTVTHNFGGSEGIQTFYRTTNTFGSLPTASPTGAVSGTGTTINLNTLGTFTYLFAKYDGQNDDSVIWNISGLTGILTIPADGPLGYGLSGWILFGPTGSVPDGGTTVMLLGAALGALGMARRFLKI